MLIVGLDTVSEKISRLPVMRDAPTDGLFSYPTIRGFVVNTFFK